MTKKQLVLPILSLTAFGIISLGAYNIAHAQTTTPFSGLAQTIAQKFNINQSDVQSAIDQYMQQQKVTMQQNIQNRQKQHLDTLVSQGTITSAQEQTILAEITKLQSEYSMQSFKTMTADQRKQAMQNRQNEIKTWSQSTGINASYLMSGFGMGHRGWKNPKVTPTPTP